MAAVAAEARSLMDDAGSGGEEAKAKGLQLLGEKKKKSGRSDRQVLWDHWLPRFHT